ncbi:MAG: sugar kinase [Gammaproteobacteria bacterium]|nr:sugar kinase [Gammaproteobacteria bacterium]
MTGSTRQLDIVCLGEPMLELNQQEDGTFMQGFGGDTSNCAISAARQGANVGYLTAIGDDPFGKDFLDLWDREGIDTSQVKLDPTAPTGLYLVTHNESGHHFTYYRKHSAASKMVPTDLNNEYISNAQILHVSAISQAISDSASDTVAEAIRTANKNNTKVAYDTNLRLNLWSKERAREVVHAAMAQCQILLPSYDDATILTQLDDPMEILDFYLKMKPEVVVLKLGDKGSIVATRDEVVSLEGEKVKSIDATGAGDTFAGAFLAELAGGSDPVQAAKYANIAAAISTQSRGAVSSIPNREQTTQRVNQSCW